MTTTQAGIAGNVTANNTRKALEEAYIRGATWYRQNEDFGGLLRKAAQDYADYETSPDTLKAVLAAALTAPVKGQDTPSPAGVAVKEPLQVGWAYNDDRWDGSHWHVCGLDSKPRASEGRRVEAVYLNPVQQPDADAVIEALRDALQNMLGVYDTPLSRRRFPLDDFMREVISTSHEALRASTTPAKEEGL